jgi:hypothetical protein
LHEFGEKMEWVLTLKLAGPCHGKNPLGEAFPGLGLVPETEFSPLDRWPDRLFGGIVGRFDSLMSEESEKMVPVIEQSFGSSPYVSIRAGQVFLAVPLHSSPHESGGAQELLASEVAFPEGMPATEDPPHFFEHIPREDIGIRAGAPILEGLELSNDVSPAKLPDPFLVVARIGRMVVRGDYPLENIPKNGSEYLGSSAGSDVEIHKQRRDKDPKVAAIPFALPPGLVGIEVAGVRKGLSCFLSHQTQLGTDPLEAVAHTSKAKIQAKKGVHDLHDASSADLVDRSEIGNGPVDSRTELALCYFRRKLGPRPVTTCASQFMTAVLLHGGFDLG